MAASIEQRTVHRIAWRIVPFVMVLYFVAFVDRVNIGFAGRAGVAREAPRRRSR